MHILSPAHPDSSYHARSCMLQAVGTEIISVALPFLAMVDANGFFCLWLGNIPAAYDKGALIWFFQSHSLPAPTRIVGPKAGTGERTDTMWAILKSGTEEQQLSYKNASLQWSPGIPCVIKCNI